MQDIHIVRLQLEERKEQTIMNKVLSRTKGPNCPIARLKKINMEILKSRFNAIHSSHVINRYHSRCLIAELLPPKIVLEITTNNAFAH